MEHIDLFSGIGGAALAVENIWPDINHTFVEIDPFCQQVLKKHFPNSQIYGDIRKFQWSTWNSSSYASQAKQKVSGRQSAKSRGSDGIYLLTGGFPCQPFSQAGRRKGTEDDRFLWPQMLRVIREFKPQWVVGENVAGLLTISGGMVFQQVLADLEAEGYEVQAFVIPAVAVNAPHRRDRVWIIAHRNSDRDGFTGGNEKINSTEAGQPTFNNIARRHSDDSNTASERCDNGFNNREERHVSHHKGSAAQSKSKREGWQRRSGEIGADVANPRDTGWGTRGKQYKKDEGSNSERRTGMARTTPKFLSRANHHASHGNGERQQRNRNSGTQIKGRGGLFNRERDAEGRDGWGRNWLEVASTLCRVDDGISKRLVRLPDGKKISYITWRKEALKGLGNAWVPQVAIEIFRAIKNISL